MENRNTHSYLSEGLAVPLYRLMQTWPCDSRHHQKVGSSSVSCAWILFMWVLTTLANVMRDDTFYSEFSTFHIGARNSISKVWNWKQNCTTRTIPTILRYIRACCYLPRRTSIQVLLANTDVYPFYYLVFALFTLLILWSKAKMATIAFLVNRESLNLTSGRIWVQVYLHIHPSSFSLCGPIG